MIFMLGGLVALVVILLVVFIPSKEFWNYNTGTHCRRCMGNCMSHPGRRNWSRLARFCALGCGGQCTDDGGWCANGVRCDEM